MRSTSIVIILCVLSILVPGIFVNRGSRTTTFAAPSDLIGVSVTTSRQERVLGEPLDLTFEVSNNGREDTVVRGVDVESGYLKIYLAGADQKYRLYSNSAWGNKHRKEFKLKAGESKRSQTKILWNFSPLGRFSDPGAYADTNVMTDYAFPAEGVYFIKAVLIIPSQISVSIESQPVQVHFTNPVGDDLKAWNMIKDRADLGYFIQQADFRTSKKAEREELRQEVEKIVSEFPQTAIAVEMKQSLERFQKNNQP